jgi:hypothetical protein
MEKDGVGATRGKADHAVNENLQRYRSTQPAWRETVTELVDLICRARNGAISSLCRLTRDLQPFPFLLASFTHHFEPPDEVMV